MMSIKSHKFTQIAGLLIVLLAPVGAIAQVAGGAISGKVMDSNGAALPGAQVTIRNTATGVTTQLVTNEEGLYRAPNLLPGDYEITASAVGFTSFLQKGITLTVGADLTIDLKLTAGAVTATVLISDVAPAVDTTTPTISAVVSERTIVELPLNGRDWTTLATLQPGISSVRSQFALGGTASRGNRGYGDELTITGHRPQENNYRIDGISINDYTNAAPGSAGGVNLGADAIKEFSVLASNYTAEYGRTSGGVINKLVQGLREDMNRSNNKGSSGETVAGAETPAPGSVKTPAAAPSETAPPEAAFVERTIEPELGGSERAETLRAKPEVFLQFRHSALPIRDGASEFKPNFTLSRAEVRWSGKVAERLGAGLEIQYHPAPAGSPEELVNDAFLEYYINDYTMVRVGQFVKPFGFDIQQSSSLRESPERAIFAGYFFPGQRDRGIMLSGDLRALAVPALKNVQYFAGVFNGNRFFVDNNRQLNFIGRLRKVFSSHFAAGFSAQVGKQLLPDGVSGNNNENIIGADFQYAVTDRLGLRAEFVAGNMPSTLR